MPVEMTVKLKIKCDNDKCPGNTLDPTVRDGWLFVSSEVYAQGPTTQHVFCSVNCVNAYTITDPASFAVRLALPV